MKIFKRKFDSNTSPLQVKSFLRSRTISKHYYYAVSNEWLFVSLKEHRSLRKSILQIFSFSHPRSELFKDSDTFEDGTYSLYSNSYIKSLYICYSKKPLFDSDSTAKIIEDDTKLQDLKLNIKENLEPLVKDSSSYIESIDQYLEKLSISSSTKFLIIQVKATEDIISAYVMNNNALIVHHVKEEATNQNQYIYLLGIIDGSTTFKNTEFHFAGYTSGLINFYNL